MAKKKKKKQQQKVIVKRKGGFFGKLLAFLMGMVMGVVCLFGGIAAIVMFVLNKPVQETYDTIEQAGFDIPGELSEYVNDEFASLTLLAAIQQVSATVGGIAEGVNTLQDLTSLSPYLEEQVSGWAEFLNGYGVPATQEELLGLNIPNVSNYLLNKLYSISIAGLMTGMDNSIDPSNAFVCALLYGKKDVHYEVTADNVIEFLPLLYTYDSTNDVFTDWDGNVFEKEGSVWVYKDNETKLQTLIGEYETATAADEGDEEITYSYEVRTLDTDNVETILYQLAQTQDDAAKYNAYKNGVLQKHTGLTIGGLMEDEGITGILFDMELYTLLNMDDNTSDLMLNLAGYQKNEDGSITLQDGKSPVTLTDLIGSESSSNIINDLKIADLMGIKENANSLMLALAFNGGVYGENPRTIKELKESNLVEELEIAQVLDLNAGSNTVMLALAYGDDYKIEYGADEDSHEDDRVYTLEDDGVTKNYSSKKISELTKNNDLINDMKLYIALGLDMDAADRIKPVIRAIAFGKQYKGEGTKTDYDYEIVDNKIVMIEGKEPKTISSIKDTTFINSLELGEIITITETSTPILKKLQNTTVENLSSAIDGLALKDVIEIDEETSPAILVALQDSTIGEGENSISNTIKTLTLEQVMDMDGAPKILQELATAKIAADSDDADSLSARVKGLTLGQVIDTTSEDTPKILTALADAKIAADSSDSNSLSSKVSNLTLSQIMDTEHDDILKHLGNSTIEGLPAAIKTLTIQQVFADDIYQKAYFDENNALLYKNPTDGKYYTDEEYTSEYTGTVNEYFIGDCGHALKKNDDDTFSHVGENISDCEGKPALTGAWKYLLTDPETDVEEECSIEKINGLIGNMTGNIQKATLYKLDSDGLVDLDINVLNKVLKIPKDPSDLSQGYEEYSIGNSTMSELITLLSHLATDPTTN